MAFNLEGTPLGLLDVQCWARDAAAFGQKHEGKQRPIEEKESSKWLKSFRRVAEVQRCRSSSQAPLLAPGPLRTGLEGFPFIRLERPRTPP
jgi:hypothetical protein